MLQLSNHAVDLPCDPQDSLKLENDIMGVRIWGPPTQPTLLLGRSDIWDRRWFGNRKPAVTLKQICEFVASDRVNDPEALKQINYGDYNRYDFPCPKPGAQLILKTPFATHSKVEQGQNNSVRLSLQGNGKRLDVDIWVALKRSLIVMECQAEGLEPGDLSVRVYRHQDTIIPGGPMHPTSGGEFSGTDFDPYVMPQCCINGDTWGITQDFPEDDTFAQGFKIAAVCAMPGFTPEIECSEGERNLGTSFYAEQEGRVSHMVTKRYTPINQALGSASTAAINDIPSKFCLYATVATTHDGDDPAREALNTLQKASEAGIDQLRAEQVTAFCESRRANPASVIVDSEAAIVSPESWGANSYAMRSHITDDGKIMLESSEIVMPSLRRIDGHYGDVALCSVDTTKFCFQDSSSWHADFHFNEVRAEPMLTLGQFDEMLSYCHMIYGLLPQAVENARDVYDKPGAVFPLVHFPLKSRTVMHTSLVWEQDMGLNGLVTKPLWLYYRYTMNLDYLREIAYPVIRECARFYHAYLTPGEDGLLHMVPCVSPEHWGLTPNFERNKDGISALTLAKYVMNVAATAARLLDVDCEEAKQWETAAGLIAPYPTYQMEDGPIWVDVVGAPPIEYNIPNPLSPVFWGDEVGLDSSEETLKLARRTLSHIKIWEPHSFYLDGWIRPRLGVWQDGAKLGPENLLLSYQSIRIFPAVPPNSEIVMENFAAQGGFKVSAVRTKDGETRDVRIHSNVGGVCCVANPWDATAVVTTSKGMSVDVSKSPMGYITFATSAGEVYDINPLYSVKSDRRKDEQGSAKDQQVTADALA